MYGVGLGGVGGLRFARRPPCPPCCKSLRRKGLRIAVCVPIILSVSQASRAGPVFLQPGPGMHCPTPSPLLLPLPVLSSGQTATPAIPSRLPVSPGILRPGRAAD